MTGEDVTAANEAKALKWIGAALLFTLALQAELIWARPVNWDEFFHLSEAHAFDQGRLTETLQVFYARAFVWLAWLPLDGVDQIRLARVFMFGCELVTLAALYGMARRFTGRAPALLVCLAYASGGYVFEHAFSFRADPMAAAFLMSALYLLHTARLGLLQALGIGVLAGLALLTTIKVVFYAPAFAAIAWLRWCETDDRPRLLRQLAMIAACSAGFTALFVYLTTLTLPPNGSGSAERLVSASGSMMFAEGLFPRWPYALGAMITAPVLATLLIKTIPALRAAQLGRVQMIAMAGLILPLASIVLYRNSFPYFYAFILPPVLIAAAFAAREALRDFSPMILALALTANAAVLSYLTPRQVLPVQQQVLAAVHDIFPEPVAYFDFPGMISDFPKANFFMTTWGVRKYWAGLEPSFSAVMARESVPLLVLNQEPLDRNQNDPAGAWEFSEADRRALRDSFVPHWGPIWVAGRRFTVDAVSTAFEIRTPGTYTVEGAGAVIDGTLLRAGDIVQLGRGMHQFARSAPGEVTLRWGNHLQRPSQPFIGGPVFKDF